MSSVEEPHILSSAVAFFLLCLAKSEEEKLKNSATLKPFFSSASDDVFIAYVDINQKLLIENA
jgi:hypothetical protein